MDLSDPVFGMMGEACLDHEHSAFYWHAITTSSSQNYWSTVDVDEMLKNTKPCNYNIVPLNIFTNFDFFSDTFTKEKHFVV